MNTEDLLHKLFDPFKETAVLRKEDVRLAIKEAYEAGRKEALDGREEEMEEAYEAGRDAERRAIQEDNKRINV
jgi:hypothetical protein